MQKPTPQLHPAGCAEPTAEPQTLVYEHRAQLRWRLPLDRVLYQSIGEKTISHAGLGVCFAALIIAAALCYVLYYFASRRRA